VYGVMGIRFRSVVTAGGADGTKRERKMGTVRTEKKVRGVKKGKDTENPAWEGGWREWWTQQCRSKEFLEGAQGGREKWAKPLRCGWDAGMPAKELFWQGGGRKYEEDVHRVGRKCMWGQRRSSGHPTKRFGVSKNLCQVVSKGGVEVRGRGT